MLGTYQWRYSTIKHLGSSLGINTSPKYQAVPSKTSSTKQVLLWLYKGKEFTLLCHNNHDIGTTHHVLSTANIANKILCRFLILLYYEVVCWFSSTNVLFQRIYKLLEISPRLQLCTKHSLCLGETSRTFTRAWRRSAVPHAGCLEDHPQQRQYLMLHHEWNKTSACKNTALGHATQFH